MRLLSVPLLVVALLAGSGFTPGHDPAWELQQSGSTARLRGLSVVSPHVAWASGSAGTVLRTVDSGRMWRSVGPAGAEALQFRDIEAFDARTAVVLSIGTGEDSRLYRTDDGGATWVEAFRNTDPTAFYDCVTFLDRRHGLALSDPVDGKFRVLSTSDGGRSWTVLPAAGMPAALAGEFAFAASGTCLVSAGRHAWFATGGGATARVFRTNDLGHTWSVVDTPIPSGPSAGVYSLAFRDPWHGVAVGGDYTTPAVAPDSAAVSRDSGRSWEKAKKTPGEYRSGVAWRGPNVIAVGPTGSDYSRDGGRTWMRFDTGSFDAVDCTASGVCWASGQAGRLAKLL
ncbi:oxidoreductase [Virgisporangium aliadipatigenens]|uniref:Oxidoreductase n=1 Tax=Virgisporangium aliadipatigenens TaxID=741659 RepID=A0A8J3YYC0_9ACTN|nr:oxidoreductase [Virgisporangium aliadipatigenens]GIJ52020.1 oxidoreductase [Virgisporangium aliadipatigenens]